MCHGVLGTFQLVVVSQTREIVVMRNPVVVFFNQFEPALTTLRVEIGVIAQAIIIGQGKHPCMTLQIPELD